MYLDIYYYIYRCIVKYMYRKSQSERVRVKEEVGPLGTGNTPQ